MDVTIAEEKLKKAQADQQAANEALKALTRQDTYKKILQVKVNSAITWRKLRAAQALFVEACLERIGW